MSGSSSQPEAHDPPSAERTSGLADFLALHSTRVETRDWRDCRPYRCVFDDSSSQIIVIKSGRDGVPRFRRLVHDALKDRTEKDGEIGPVLYEINEPYYQCLRADRILSISEILPADINVTTEVTSIFKPADDNSAPGVEAPR